MDDTTAYSKGYRASARTRTADLDAASDRFAAAHGTAHLDMFCAGWGDYAADRPKGYSLALRIQSGIVAGTHTVADWNADGQGAGE